MLSRDGDHWLDLAIKLRLGGKFTQAIDACRRATEAAPKDAKAWSELAHALRLEGRLEEARHAATRAIEHAPGLAGGWFNLGAVLLALGETSESIEANRKTVALDPEFAEAWSNLGAALGATGDKAGEIESYRRALDINPRLAPVWSNLGNALLETGKVEDAISACSRAIELAPDFAAAWNNLGDALREHGQAREAIRACERAVQLCPDSAVAWNNLGGALLEGGGLEQAIAALERALVLEPRNAPAIHNLGVTYEQREEDAAAMESYRRALEVDPNFATAGFRLACMLLKRGDFAEGWAGYEYRLREKGADPKRFDFTPWAGDTLPGKRLLVWGEQGVGDEIMHSSMIPELVKSGMSIALETDPRLVPLMERSFPGAKVVPRRTPPAFDPADFECQTPLASLGRHLRPSFDAFPQHKGYLKANPMLTASLSARLRRADPETAIGISWISANRKVGFHKSSTLSDWAQVLGLPGFRFVDLQYGDTARARDELRRRHGLEITHLDDLDLFHNLDALAALCAACDLIITVSNVTAHMAGSLGKPVWLLAPLAKGRIWYWFSGRGDSPWYPSMRIFTQPSPDNWRAVLDQVAEELTGFANDR